MLASCAFRLGLSVRADARDHLLLEDPRQDHARRRAEDFGPRLELHDRWWDVTNRVVGQVVAPVRRHDDWPDLRVATGPQAVRLTQNGPGTVTWTATPTQPWIQVTPSSGTGPADLSVSVVAAAGLPLSGSVSGAARLNFTGAATAEATVDVTLNLMAPGTSPSPFGSIDTPTDLRTGVTGAVPFTGWALDDIEVTRVMICRSAFGAEVAPVDPNCGGAAQIFVGLPVFIDGARPDVAEAFPTSPMNHRAGWGFMVLTNTLPNQGNGTYVFHVWAEDREATSYSWGRGR